MRPKAPARESQFSSCYSSSGYHDLCKDFASVLGGSDQALILRFPVPRGHTLPVICALFFFPNDCPLILTNILTPARYKDFDFIGRVGDGFYYWNAL